MLGVSTIAGGSPSPFLPPRTDVGVASEIAIWALRLACPVDQSDLAVLDREERERAEHFARPVDRMAFVSIRAVLRRALGARLGRPAASFRFCADRLGKLSIAEPAGLGAVGFSVSHTEGMGLIAVGPRAVGVDVERIRPIDDCLSIAEKAFDPRLAMHLRGHSRGEAERLFFRCWTAGEALAKATGLGLAGLGGRFPVLLNGPPMRPEIAGKPQTAGWWHLTELDVGPRFAASLVCRAGDDGAVSAVRWQSAGVEAAT